MNINAIFCWGSQVFKGRAISLYQEVHTLQTKEKPTTHKAFLHRLKTMVGEKFQPIIVTDAGFKGPVKGRDRDMLCHATVKHR